MYNVENVMLYVKMKVDLLGARVATFILVVL